MIVNRAHAEEASKELLVHALFLQGITAEQVNEAYRSRARETHPDAGGDAADFARVDRAKHILLEWLKRNPESAAPAALGGQCPRCEGNGYVNIQRGFRAMRMQCPRCHGTGDADYTPDRTGD